MVAHLNSLRKQESFKKIMSILERPTLTARSLVLLRKLIPETIEFN